VCVCARARARECIWATPSTKDRLQSFETWIQKGAFLPFREFSLSLSLLLNCKFQQIPIELVKLQGSGKQDTRHPIETHAPAQIIKNYVAYNFLNEIIMNFARVTYTRSWCTVNVVGAFVYYVCCICCFRGPVSFNRTNAAYHSNECCVSFEWMLPSECCLSFKCRAVATTLFLLCATWSEPATMALSDFFKKLKQYIIELRRR